MSAARPATMAGKMVFHAMIPTSRILVNRSWDGRTCGERCSPGAEVREANVTLYCLESSSVSASVIPRRTARSAGQTSREVAAQQRGVAMVGEKRRTALDWATATSDSPAYVRHTFARFLRRQASRPSPARPKAARTNVDDSGTCSRSIPLVSVSKSTVKQEHLNYRASREHLHGVNRLTLGDFAYFEPGNSLDLLPQRLGGLIEQLLVELLQFSGRYGVFGEGHFGTRQDSVHRDYQCVAT